MSDNPTMLFLHKGPGEAIYKVGAGGEMGAEGGEEKLYCQVRMPPYSITPNTPLYVSRWPLRRGRPCF